MSCDVIYQPFAPYFPSYQRPAESPTIGSTPSPFHEKYGSKVSSVESAGVPPETARSSTSYPSPQPETDKGGGSNAQYLSHNCVLFTYFTGDTQAVVDEHFTRALSQETCAKENSPTVKDHPCPMSQRNFPPSFWNSNYQHTPSTSMPLLPHPSQYNTTSFTQSDPWSHYPYSWTSSELGSYPAVATSSRFTPVQSGSSRWPSGQYGSFLFPHSPGARPSMTAQYGPHPSSVDPSYSSGGYHHMAGMESGAAQDGSKDLYWF